MRTILGCVAVVALCGLVSADDKIDAKLLVGKWEPKEKKEGVTFAMEFQKDGKLTVTRTANGKESKVEGTYKVDGTTLTVTASADGKEKADTRTITKLTEAEFVTTGTGDTKEFTMVRVNDKK